MTQIEQIHAEDFLMARRLCRFKQIGAQIFNSTQMTLIELIGAQIFDSTQMTQIEQINAEDFLMARR